MASATAAEQARPPPAHVNKVKTEPFLRDISPSSFDGRPLTTPPHASHTSPSPGPPRPPSSSSRGVIPTTQAYMGRNPLPQPSVAGRQPALSPKVTSKPPLTIQTGSITQGTPVQQGAQQRYGEPLLKMTPPDVRAAGGGSITQGTPVYDKTARRIQESAYFAQAQGAAGRNAAAALAAANAAAAGFPDQHLTSRQVIMNDYAMARSNEMQRRPDSRDAHGRSVSPSARGSLRDLSPRPRTLDPRTAAAAAAQLSRDGRPTSSDPRLDPRYIAAVAASEQQHRSISGLPEPRGDPKADIPALHKDPRGLQRAQPASTLSRSYFIGPSTTVSAPSSQLSSQQVFLTSDGRFAARSRSPPRSTPPPSTRPGMSQITQSQMRQGGITSGKPIVSKEMYRGPPEVTISKTSSPRGTIGYGTEVANNPLASLVDVAVQQPKLDLNQLTRQQAALAMLAVNHSKASAQLSSAASLVSPSASQLIQQVQAERNKQQFYLVNEAAAAAAAAGGYSSAARITASTKQPQGGPSNVSSRADAPAVIISERDRMAQMKQYSSMTGMTGQSLIDHIITQTIGGGTTDPELVKAAALAKAQAEAATAAEAAARSAAAAAAAAAAASVRPPSHEQSTPSHKPTLPPDMVLNRELSITPASSNSAEDFMKKRQILITTSATLTPTSSHSTPTSRPVSDERQITRVAQSVSPAVNKPTGSIQTEASGNSGNPASISLDLKPRVSLPEAVLRPPSVSEASPRPLTAPPNGDQPPPGMNPLDYVKNKIMEEMKKHKDEDLSMPGSGGQKRASPEASTASGTTSEDTSNKKARLEGSHENANANPPDSPGSPGEMVIDERPDDPKTASNEASNNPNNSSNEAAKSTPVTTSNSTASTAATAAALGSSVTAPPNSSKYEPLSDDE